MSTQRPDRFEPVAGVLAVVFPGAGHAYLRQPKRAVLIAAGVLGLFFGGVFIGGIDVIDRREDFVWFLGQGLVGPVAFGVDYLHQHHFKVRDASGRGGRPVLRSARPDEARQPGTGAPVAAGPGRGPPNSKSLARMNELGTLYATIAGMLNFIAILDALFHPRRGEHA